MQPDPDTTTGGRPSALLEAEGVTAGYSKLPIIDGVSIRVGRGETVLVIGPNGAGKSTLVKSINGELALMAGRIRFDGADVGDLSADLRARRGIGYVPQLNDVFPTLDVHENLEMGGYQLPVKVARARIAELLERFPQLSTLRRRTASTLSGGERKLVGIARALVADPALLILDEPTSNLSPQAADRILNEVVVGLAGAGRAILLIEQRVALALPVADWVHVLVAGRPRHDGPAASLDPESIAEQFFFDAAGAAPTPA